MRVLTLLLTVSLLGALAASPTARAADPLSAADQVAQMKRGVNILGYDPIWQDPARARFQLRHFKIIKDGGFDHVRINLHAFRHMDAQFKLPERWFATLDSLVTEATRQGLHVILDEHDFEICATEVTICRTKVLAFWEQVGAHYRDAPNTVIFELLNEPNRALDAHWNDLLVDALTMVRKTHPTRNVIIGPAFWNNFGWLEKLKLPEQDRHLIVTIHYYEPFRFTHQGASWAPDLVNVSGVRWGSAEDYARIERDFDVAQAWAKKHDRPLYLGEFGAYDKAPAEDRPKYTAAVARAAEKRGWAWGYWQFDSNFVVYDIGKDQWNEPIWRALVPR